MRIAYFTAGTIGAGHHVRGLAIGRALERAGFRGEYRTLGPPTRFGHVGLGTHVTVELDPDELTDPARVEGSSLARALASFDPDVVLVDMFWAPLQRTLPRLRGEAWLLARTCVPVWFVGPKALPFDRSLYARVLAIEPSAPLDVAKETLEPIVIANPDECRPPGALRERFAVPEGTRLEVVMHAGLPGERGQLEASSGAGTRVLDLYDADALFPAAEWLGGADAIACGAGYNSFWEARWLGYADRTTFRAFARPIDDQEKRVRTCGGHVMRDNGADLLARALVGR